MSKPERNIIKMEELLERDQKTNVMFLNYDNEAFMNTGIQESGSTPPFAATTTGPAGEKIPGKVGIKQDLVTPFGFFGSNSLFLATANPAYPNDFIGKVIEGLKTNGSSFIQAYADCMRGWRHAGSETIKISKLATDCGYWPLYTIRVRDGIPKFSYYRGLDIDKEELIQAPEGSYDEIICTDITKYRGNLEADIVICQALLEHVKGVENAFMAISSILKPGGLALIFVPFIGVTIGRGKTLITIHVDI